MTEKQLVADATIPDGGVVRGCDNWRHALWVARQKRDRIRAAAILRRVREWKYPDLQEIEDAAARPRRTRSKPRARDARAAGQAAPTPG